MANATNDARDSNWGQIGIRADRPIVTPMFRISPLVRQRLVLWLEELASLGKVSRINGVHKLQCTICSPRNRPQITRQARAMSKVSEIAVRRNRERLRMCQSESPPWQGRVKLIFYFMLRRPRFSVEVRLSKVAGHGE